MSPEDFQEVSEIFLAARTMAPDARAAFLTRRCSNRTDVRREVERLLAQDGERHDALDDSAMLDGLDLDAVKGLFSVGDGTSAAASAPERPLPATIGRYRIVRKLGEGGMGIVCEAEQQNPRRSVAIKILRFGVGSAGVLKRFALEAQTLARLHHPGIARIYDAGTTDIADGAQPYFAMELITGRPILEHAQAAGLGTRERLSLFLAICDAVEYAHQKGVIHRDLKPANILVDEHGSPRILDFGVARVTDADIQATTLHTHPGQLVGTLPYMSPEQVGGDIGAVDTRTDVYALGVVLFQLLSGRLPLDTRSRTIADAARIIRDQEPTRLGSLDTAFRGDLETIVSRALEKETARRYQSAASLGADIRRFLNNEPIDARPTTHLYQLRKFARRHPELVVGVAAVVVATGLGLAGTLWGMMRAREQRDVAREQAKNAVDKELIAQRAATRSARLASAMQRILDAANPGTGIAAGEGTIELLNQAAKEVGVDLAEEPEAELTFRTALGKTFRGMGAFQAEIYSFRRADEIASQLYGADSPRRLQTAEDFATSLCNFVTGGLANAAWLKEGQTFAAATLDSARRVLGPSHKTTVSLFNVVAYLAIYDVCTPEGAELNRDFVKLLRQLPPHERPCSLSFALSRLAVCLAKLHDDAGAQAAADEAFAIFSGGQQPADYDTVSRQLGLPIYLLEVGRIDDAIEVLREGIQRIERNYGASHHDSLTAKKSLEDLLHRTGDTRAAIIMQSDRLAASRPLLRRFEPVLAIELSRLAYLLAVERRYEESLRLYGEAMEVLRHAPGGQKSYEAAKTWSQCSLICGLKTLGPWSSDTLRMETRFALTDQMLNFPSRSLDPSKVHWETFRYRLAPHGIVDAPAHLGDVNDIRSRPEPPPGVYQMQWSVADEDTVRRVTDWVLFTTWHVRKYGARFFRINQQREWNARIQLPPEEEVDASTLTAMGWWGRGFGPIGREYTFGLIADTTIDLPPGSYQFALAADDGGAVTLDGRKIIDIWPDSDRRSKADALVALSAGPHDLRVEYVQWGDMSRLRFRITPLAPNLPP